MLLRTLHGLPPPPPPSSRTETNSPGGVVSAGLAVYDTMQYVRPDICTIAMGQAASMGSLLLTAGSPGMRMILPNAKVNKTKGIGWGLHASCLMWRSAQSRKPRSLLFRLFSISWSQSASPACFHGVFMRRLQNTLADIRHARGHRCVLGGLWLSRRVPTLECETVLWLPCKTTGSLQNNLAARTIRSPIARVSWV